MLNDIDAIIGNIGLNEVTYNKFKNTIKHRNNSEQLHKAIKEAASKLKEINELIDHTTRLKQELSENDDAMKYWKKTEKSVHSLREVAQKICNKINGLIQ